MEIFTVLMISLVFIGIAYVIGSHTSETKKEKSNENKDVVKDNFYLKRIHFWIEFWSVMTLLSIVLYIICFMVSQLC